MRTMLRHRANRRDAPGLRDGDTRPLIHPIEPPPPRALPSIPPPRLRDRLRAAGIHLLLSAAVGAAVLAIVVFAWYPPPMHTLIGVGAILLIMLGVDVVIGPVFTLLVYDRRKRNLRWDLATIAALQLLALGYGVWTVHQGRPAFVVLVKDRFEVVSPAELRPADRAAAQDNPHARAVPLSPRWVAAKMPDGPQERSDILFEALAQGRDVQHHPKLYVALDAQSAVMLERALPISRLRSLNPQSGRHIDAAVAATGRPEDALSYLPLRGPASDGAVLIGRSDARVLRVAAFAPW
jgi:hypothetical protein